MDRTYTVLYEQGLTSWGASSPDAVGCFAVAETREEVEVLMAGAMQEYVNTLVADGADLPEPVHYAGVVTVTVPRLGSSQAQHKTRTKEPARSG